MSNAEHTTRIDITKLTSPYAFQIMIHLRRERIEPFIDDMEKRGLLPHFRAHMKPFKTSGRVFVFFGQTCMDPTEDWRALHKFLRLMWCSKLDIIWKQGQFGYRIDAHAHIKQKWRLTQPYVPESEGPTDDL